MKELDIDALMASMQKPAVGRNAGQIMEMLSQADAVLKQVETVMSRLDSMGLKPLLVRGLGAKLGIDAESPLKSEQGTETYKSPTHKQVIESINQLAPEQLQSQLEMMKNEAGTKKAQNYR